MSDVEKLFQALSAKFGATRHWSQLHPMEQAEFVDAVNVILRIIYRGVNG